MASTHIIVCTEDIFIHELMILFEKREDKTMSNDIYFTTTSGKLITNHDIAKAAIINGDTIDEYNLDDVRKYASRCNGIVKEINPSIKVCLQNGDKITAVKLYYYRHPGIGLKDAKNIIDDMEAKMKLGILK